MRRFFLGLAIASLTASAPVTAFGGDREIADSIISAIKSQQSSGSLKGFDIDLSVESGIVMLTGSVANHNQAAAVLLAAREAEGVREVVDQITVRGGAPASKSVATSAKTIKPINIDSRVRPASGVEDQSNPPMFIGAEEAPVPHFEVNGSNEPPKMEIATAAVSPEDAGITDEALRKLAQAKSAGTLRQFELDVSTVDRDVWVKGYVANEQQKQLVLRTVQQVRGVRKIIDDLKVSGGKVSTQIQAASNTRVIEPQVGSMPVMGPASAGPQSFAQSTVAAYDEGMVSRAPTGNPQPMMQTPVAMNMGQSYGAGVPRSDSPQMPGYAWPSYAAYPNYSAVTYPKQYSASAWPYIGPFYPYPQVPLGWRKVALEWDDGLWYLDFTSK